MSAVEMKMVIVGDAHVGKTCFQRALISKFFPTESLSRSTYGTFVNDISVNGTDVRVILWNSGEYIMYVVELFSAIVDNNLLH